MTAPAPSPAPTKPAPNIFQKVLSWLNLGTVIANLEKKLPFGIDNWPLWSNEGLGGYVTWGIISTLLPTSTLVQSFSFCAYVALRHLYEAFIDVYGYNGLDITWNIEGAILAWFTWTPLIEAVKHLI